MASGRKVAVKGRILHAVEVNLSSKRRGRVLRPLVRSKQPGTVALDNAKIFDIISFP